MSSSNQVNRNNSLKSTGPKTSEGKRRSSQNAVKHGIFAKNILLPAEDSQEFHFHKSGLLRRLNPRDVLELHLVEQIVADTWAIKRVRATEQQLYAEANPSNIRAELNVRRAQIAQLREELFSCQDPKRRLTLHNRLDEAEQKLLDLIGKQTKPSAGELLADLLDSEKLARLDRYQRRLSSSLHRSLKELRELRKEKDDPDEPLTDLAAAIICDMISNDDEPAAQNEAISNASNGPIVTCDVAPLAPLDHSDDSSSLEKRIEERMHEENDPSAIPKAA